MKYMQDMFNELKGWQRIEQKTIGDNHFISIYDEGLPIEASCTLNNVNNNEEFKVIAKEKGLTGNDISIKIIKYVEGQFNWVPTKEQSGVYNIIFETDEGEVVDSETINNQSVVINVEDTNRKPIIKIDDKVINENGKLKFIVNENEELKFTVNITDPDNDDLILNLIGLPNGASFNKETGKFSWIPESDQIGDYVVKFEVSDGKLKESETIIIQVKNVNESPKLNHIGNKTIKESNKLIEISTINDIINGDLITSSNEYLCFRVTASDVDNDDLTFNTTELPKGAYFNNQTGIFFWQPTSKQNGNYNITFTVSDGELTDSETINIIVDDNIIDNSSYDLISIDNINNQIIEDGQTLNFNVIIEEPTNNDNKIKINVEGLPNGASFNKETGRFSWTPTKEQIGNHIIRFEISEFQNEICRHGIKIIGETEVRSDTKEVIIKVVNSNNPPILDFIDNKIVYEGEELEFFINAIDPNKDDIIFNAINLPEGASFDSDIQKFSWIPSKEQSGSYNITFEASDGEFTDKQNVKIHVIDVNNAPILNKIGDKNINVKDELTFEINGTDSDGDNINYSVINLPEDATFSNNIFSWIPTDKHVGNHIVTFKISDGIFETSETIVIKVIPEEIESKPSIINSIGDKSIKTNQLLNFTVSAYDVNDIKIRDIDNLPEGINFEIKYNFKLEVFYQDSLMEELKCNTNPSSTYYAPKHVSEYSKYINIKSLPTAENINILPIDSPLYLTGGNNGEKILELNCNTKELLINGKILSENITNTNLSSENITNTKLLSENITNTNLSSENITNTNLSSENITNTNLSSENKIMSANAYFINLENNNWKYIEQINVDNDDYIKFYKKLPLSSNYTIGSIKKHTNNFTINDIDETSLIYLINNSNDIYTNNSLDQFNINCVEQFMSKINEPVELIAGKWLTNNIIVSSLDDKIKYEEDIDYNIDIINNTITTLSNGNMKDNITYKIKYNNVIDVIDLINENNESIIKRNWYGSKNNEEIYLKLSNKPTLNDELISYNIDYPIKNDEFIIRSRNRNENSNNLSISITEVDNEKKEFKLNIYYKDNLVENFNCNTNYLSSSYAPRVILKQSKYIYIERLDTFTGLLAPHQQILLKGGNNGETFFEYNQSSKELSVNNDIIINNNNTSINGLILTSPNGTQYKLKVDDTGQLNTELMT
ncbi:MAG: putative Ig domain-containing protein [archaeon]